MSIKDQTSKVKHEPPKTAELTLARLRDPALWVALGRELRLSPRELDVAILLATGHSVRQMAEALGIERYTVKTYLIRLRRKVGVADRTALVVALYMRSGLLLEA